MRRNYRWEFFSENSRAAKSFSLIVDAGAVVNFTKAKFDGAPRLDYDGGSESFVKLLAASYSYFGRKFPGDPKCQRAQPIRSQELVGSAIQNKNSESLGKVVNLMIDVTTERVVFVIVSLQGGKHDLYAVPPSALHLTAGKKTLFLDAETSRVAVLAQSDGFFWANLADAELGVATYHAFGQVADFDVAAENAAEKSVVSSAAAPAVAKSVSADSQKKILGAITRDDPANDNIFKTIAILTANGKVTLMGHLRNEQEKSKLLGIVGGVVGPENVRDQIQVF